MNYNELRVIILRGTKQADLDVPSLHDFRKSFVPSMLKSGTDIFTSSMLMGHKGIHVLKLYLKQKNENAEFAHQKASPG